MSPRTMTLAYLIWCDCQTHGWARTVAEIADSLGEDEARVRRVAQIKQWLSRMRSMSDRDRETPLTTADFDEQLDRLGGARRYGSEDLAA